MSLIHRATGVFRGVFLCMIILEFTGCTAGLSSAGSSSATGAMTAPGLAAIRTELGRNNAWGMIPGAQGYGDVTLPECTSENVVETTYSLSGLPGFLSFDAATRVVSATGPVSNDARLPISVTFTCADTSDPNISDLRTFDINDLDGGGVTDGWEHLRKPLLGVGFGWIPMTASTIDLYRPMVGGARKIPTGMTLADPYFDPQDPRDDAGDIDGDGISNTTETNNGTNLFVAAGPGTFTGPIALTTGGGFPQFGAAGDFNEDGHVDLATTLTTATNDQLRIHIGDGTGALASGNTYSHSGSVNVYHGIAAADLDNDGDLDLAISHGDDSHLCSWGGNGDGTFTAETFWTVGGTVPLGIVAADLNNNGNIDVATVNNGTGNISVFMGNGDRTFQSPVNYGVGATPQNIVAGDWDDDGDLDLAVTNADSVTVFLNDGAGTFSAAGSPTVGNGPYGIVTADFDGDGILDLAVGNTDAGGPSPSLSILLGDGDGTFSAASGSPIVLEVGSLPEGIIAADLDGDNDVDLAVADNSTYTFLHRILVLSGNGDGTFGASTDYLVGADRPFGLVAADLNNDNRIDLASINSASDSGSLFLNNAP